MKMERYKFNLNLDVVLKEIQLSVLSKSIQLPGSKGSGARFCMNLIFEIIR